MAVINVYEQYYEAEALANGVQRHAVLAGLQSDSEGGQISYRVFLSFFPHNDPEDFAVSYDAYAEKVIYAASGRRSKKREKAFLESFRETADALAAGMDAQIFWDKPLREARNG